MPEYTQYYLALMLIKRLYEENEIPEYMYNNITRDISNTMEKLENTVSEKKNVAS